MFLKIKTCVLLLVSGLLASFHVNALDVKLAYIGDENSSAYLGASQGLNGAGGTNTIVADDVENSWDIITAWIHSLLIRSMTRIFPLTVLSLLP